LSLPIEETLVYRPKGFSRTGECAKAKTALPHARIQPMTDQPTPLATDFPEPDAAQWRGLVDKILKGADYDKRLVSRTADGLAIQPLYTSAPASPALPIGGRPAHGWDIRQRHTDADPAAANRAILEDLAGGVTSITLQIDAPGQSGLSYRAEPIAQALEGVLLDVCPIALDAGDNTLDAAGSLMALWRARGVADDKRVGAFNFDPLGTLARTGTLTQPVHTTLATAAKLAAD
jgi:methylmalonyl-CoA mutase